MTTTQVPAPAKPKKAATKRGRWFVEVAWKYPLALIVVFIATFPLVYIFSASLAKGGSLSGTSRLFSSVSLENYKALGDTYYWTWVVNTLEVGFATAIGATLMGAAAAYAFSRFRFKGRRTSLTSLLIIQMFPQTVAFIAVFLLLIALGNVVPALGLNSKIALICVYLGGALGSNTFLMYGFFNSVPTEIDEAAKVDGATHAQTFWRLIMPLVTPILAVVALLGFISAFGDFILSKVVLTKQENWTLAVGMYGWVSDQFTKNWGLFAAGAMIAAIPILVLFLLLQRYIVGGLSSGSVKG